MKQRSSHYIYVFIFIFSFKGLFAQEHTLKLSSANKKDISILDEIEYQNKHKDSSKVNNEVKKISEYLKKNGYFINTIDSIKVSNKIHIAYFSLNKKIDTVVIKIDPDIKLRIVGFKISNNTISIPIEKLLLILSDISNKLDKQGQSFSKIQLKDIIISSKKLYATLEIKKSKKRVINKVVLNEYVDFPKSFLKNYFNIKSTSLFNQQKIKEISNTTKSLNFITEIKPPEVLFTKDSTLLYMYIRKKQNNSFDGVINFASKENGGVLLNGNIELKLNNILNKGEKFELFWNSIGEEKQEFKLSTEIPYIFNSKISPYLSFSIYKQDSTFLSTKFDSKLQYNINNKLNLALTYNSESSENIKKNQLINNETFNNYFLGIQLKYSILKNDFFNNKKFYFDLNPGLGKRITNNNVANQFKIETSTSYIWDISLRSSIFIKNKIGYLNSDTYVNNELFRVGGLESIRGITEQSIFTNNYNYINLEYRYLTSEKSYLYTITDVGKAKTALKNKTLIGLGLGYLFTSNNSQINLSASTGVNTSQNIGFNSIQLFINWKNFF